MDKSYNPTGNKIICYFCLMLFTLSMLIICSANMFRSTFNTIAVFINSGCLVYTGALFMSYFVDFLEKTYNTRPNNLLVLFQKVNKR